MANVQFILGRDLKGSLTTEEHTSISTSYDKTKAHAHPIGRFDSDLGHEGVYGECLGVWIEFDNKSSATKLSVMVCADSDCDVPLLEAQDVDLTLGLTTNTKGTVQIYMGMPFYCGQDTPSVYVVCKTDAGTLDLQKSQISWRI